MDIHPHLGQNMVGKVVRFPAKKAGVWCKGKVTKANRYYYSLESTHRFPHTQNYKGVRKALARIHEDGDLQIAHPELPIWFSSASLASGAYAEIIPSPVDAENRRKSDDT